MSRLLIIGLILLAAVAIVLRTANLAQRPMHCDEAVHAIKLKNFWAGNGYKYDPHEYHGPDLYYFTLPVLFLKNAAPNLSNISEADLRIIPAIFGFLTVLVLLLLTSKKAGQTWNNSIYWAMALLGISGPFVFYSRYFIHETLLVFFTVLFAGALLRYYFTTNIAWVLVAGLALGLMHSSKETFVFNLFGLAAGGIFEYVLGLKNKTAIFKPNKKIILHTLLALVVAFFVSLTFFTSFFSDLDGIADSVKTYVFWFERSQKLAVHHHPWYYYFGLLIYNPKVGFTFGNEGFITLMALFGAVVAFMSLFKPDSMSIDFILARFIAIYTLVVAFIYSAIPYKTPWCLLNFWLGAIILAGWGISNLFEKLRKSTYQKILAFFIVCIGLLLTFFHTWSTSFRYFATPANPYVYAHTSPDIMRLVNTVQRLAEIHPNKKDMLIKVMVKTGDYWPLPWYFRDLNKCGWWSSIPTNPEAPVVISSPEFDSELEPRFKGRYVPIGYYALRHAVFLEAYVDLKLWTEYLKKFPPLDSD